VRGHGGAAALLPSRVVSPSVTQLPDCFSTRTHGGKVHDSCFCLINSRSATTTTTTTLPTPLSSSFPHCICTCVCLSLLCLHPRRQLPSAHVPPPPPTSPTPITRHLGSAHAKLQAQLGAHLPCRHRCSPHPQSLSARSSSAVRFAEFDSLFPCVVCSSEESACMRKTLHLLHHLARRVAPQTFAPSSATLIACKYFYAWLSPRKCIAVGCHCR
jgi:hypothetical protein